MYACPRLLSTSLVIALLSFAFVSTATAQACNCGMNYNPFDGVSVSSCNTRCEIAQQTGQAVGAFIDEMKKESQLLDTMRAATWYGAIAQSADHQIVAVTLESSREGAQQLALKGCAQKSPGGTCRVTRDLKNQCAAAASGSSKERFVSVSGPENSGESSAAALHACSQKAAECKVLFQVCATGEAAIAKYREEQRAESQPTIDAIPSCPKAGRAAACR